LIDNRIRLSGLARGDFFIQSCTRQKIVTTGNIKTFDAIRESVKKIDGHLQEIHMSEEFDEGILVELRTILELLDSIYNEEADNDE
jgi:hypothetical protein